MRKSLFLVLVIVGFLSGCFGGFPEVKRVGIIEGYVKDIFSDDPIGNAVVRIQDVEYQTDGQGFFPLYRRSATTVDDQFIVPKEKGDAYSLTRSGYRGKMGVNIFAFGQKNLMGYMTPYPGKNRYEVIGKIGSSAKDKLEGINVIVNSLASGEPFKTITDSNGVFNISNVPEGIVNIYIYAEGYNSFSKTITLDGDWNEDVKLTINSTKKYGEVVGQIRGYQNEGCGFSFVSWGQRGSDSYQFNIADASGAFHLYGIPIAKNSASTTTSGSTIIVNNGETTLFVRAQGFYKDNNPETTKVKISTDESGFIYNTINMEMIPGE